MFKQLLYKLTTDYTMQFNQSFYEQIDRCAMGSPLSVILADIHMVRTENEVVKPTSPLFYKDLLTIYTAEGISFNKMPYLKL